MTGYELSKKWFDYVRENPENINPNQHALYFWICEKWNSLGKPEKFGLPSSEAMFIMGINSYKTFKKTFDSLVDSGFLEVVQYSKNQFTSNIVALVKNTKAQDKAHTKASPTHLPSQVQRKDTISKELNNKITKDVNVPDDDGDFESFESLADKEKRERKESGAYNFDSLNKVDTAKKLFGDEKVNQNIGRHKLSSKQGSTAIQDFVNFCDDNEKFPRNYQDSRSHFYNWIAKKDINIYRR